MIKIYKCIQNTREGGESAGAVGNKSRVRRTHLELHEVHCVQILLLHVHPAHAVAHAARLLVLVLPANNFFNLLGHLRRGQLARDVASEGGAGDLHAWLLCAYRLHLDGRRVKKGAKRVL